MGFLEGKTAIITGAGFAALKDGSAGSIGYGIATAYAKEGANGKTQLPRCTVFLRKGPRAENERIARFVGYAAVARPWKEAPRPEQLPEQSPTVSTDFPIRGLRGLP